MKIIIIGAGRIGESVAETLLSEDNDITVVDTDSERLRDLQDRFDLRGMLGDGISADVLADAGAADAELLVACAARDETNLVACKVAQIAFGIPTRIARLHSVQHTGAVDLLGKDGFAVDAAICPEDLLTRYIARLVEFPQALQVRDFAGGLARLVSVRATATARLARHTIGELRELAPDVAMRIVAIYRQLWDGPDQLIMTDANTRIEPGDEVFVFAPGKQVAPVLEALHPQPAGWAGSSGAKAGQRILVAGGGRVGENLARQLVAAGQGHNVKIIESDPAHCVALASRLPDEVLVLQGAATDEDLLETENIAGLDLFLALSDDDEDNIMAALLAKRMGARRVLALINRRSYAELMYNTRIDIALSPAQAVMGELLAHIRRGEVRAVQSLRRGVAEAIEIVARGTRRRSRVVGRTIADLKLPAGAQVGIIIRGISSSDETADDESPAQAGEAPEPATEATAEARVDVRGAQVIIPGSDTVIESGDHVVLFLPARRLIRDVEKLFRVSATFF